eukprot:3435878-Pyramimonas_sp.AAC.1
MAWITAACSGHHFKRRDANNSPRPCCGQHWIQASLAARCGFTSFAEQAAATATCNGCSASCRYSPKARHFQCR